MAIQQKRPVYCPLSKEADITLTDGTVKTIKFMELSPGDTDKAFDIYLNMIMGYALKFAKSGEQNGDKETLYLEELQKAEEFWDIITGEKTPSAIKPESWLQKSYISVLQKLFDDFQEVNPYFVQKKKVLELNLERMTEMKSLEMASNKLLSDS